ncbi:MAG: VOC family protein [Chloroflexi bacterium]|nr:VOC family protein [Chloroflexota bacterium]
MLLGIDHVVMATADPDTAADELETRLGLAASGGGRHEAMGTFNRLVWLGDAYLELVGVFDRGLAEESWFGRPVVASLDRGGGLVTWAITVDDLDEALRWAPPDDGLSEALAGERRRSDGRLVRWRLARPDGPSSTEPFLIEHDVSAAEWTSTERAAAPMIATHSADGRGSRASRSRPLPRRPLPVGSGHASRQPPRPPDAA